MSEEDRKVFEEWYGKGGKLEQSGFVDVEAYRPHQYGTHREPMLGKSERFVSLELLLPSEDGSLPADEPLFDFYDSNTYTRFSLLEGMALAGILRRENWEAVTALSLFCEGVSERQVSDIIGRSRGKTRDLIRNCKLAVDTPEKILILGGEERED